MNGDNQVQPDAQSISMESITAYMKDLDLHTVELSKRRRLVNNLELDEAEAEKQNLQSLLLFHEKLT